MKFYNNFIGSNESNLRGFNSNGHLCEEIETVVQSDYILYVGGDSREFSDALSETPHYNLSVDGSGVDIVLHNVIAWFYTVTRPPKALIIRLPNPNIFASTDTKRAKIKEKCDIVSFGPVDKRDSVISDVITAGEITQYFECRELLAKKLIASVCDCPVHYVTDNITGVLNEFL